MDATPPEANAPNPAELVVKLRCYLLSLLRIHHPDCEHCNADEMCGDEMRKRLEALREFLWTLKRNSPPHSCIGENEK